MAATGGVVKPRRRLATYGKASRRALLGLRSPNLANECESGALILQQQDDVGVLESNNSSLRKVGVHTTIKSSNRDGPGRNGTFTSEHMEKEDLQTLLSSADKDPIATDPNVYEVPSSDEDRPPNRNSRPIPKRRKIRKKEEKEATATKSIVMMDARMQKPQRHNGVRTLQTKMPLPNLPNPLSTVLQSQGDPILSKNLEARKVRQSPVRSQYSSPRPPNEAPKFFRDETVCPVLDSSPTARTSAREHDLFAIHNLETKIRAEVRDHEDNLAQSSSVQTADLVFTAQICSSPKTRARNMSTPEAERNGFNSEQAVFLSPGGLDFPNLSISNSIKGYGHFPRINGAMNHIQSEALLSKPKLKDRLAARNGIKRQELSSSVSDAESSIDEAVDNVQPKGLLESDYHSEYSGSQLINMGHKTPIKPASLVAGAGPKVTYTARQRTLRREENQDDVLLGLSLAGDLDFERPVRRIKVQPDSNNKTQGSAVDGQGHNDSQATSLRTIHELREAGGNARISGQTETLLDDIDSDNISTKRSGLLDLCVKLEQPGFRTQFLANGLEARLLPHVQSCTDLIANIFLSIAMLRAVSNQVTRHALEQFHGHVFLEFLAKLLDETDGVRAIVRNRKSNSTKLLRKETEEMFQAILKSSIWKFGRPIQVTPRSLSLQCLEYLVRQSRGAGFREEMLSQATTERLIAILVETIPTKEDGPATWKNENDVQLTLSVLESSALSSSISHHQGNGRWTSESLEAMASFLASSCEWQTENQDQIWTLTLRLCLNLTNNNAHACRIFSSSKVLGTVLRIIGLNFDRVSNEVEEDSRALMVDNLILSLGFLINLAERSEESRGLFLKSSTNAPRLLDTLLHLFTTRWIRAFEVVSEEESRTSVPLGYLAVLLGFLSVDLRIRRAIASKLEGGTLKHLLVAVDEFLNYNRKITDEGHEPNDELGVKAQFTGRLQAVVDQLKEQENDIQT